MTDWMGNAVPGARPQPEDEATRQARHEVLATLLGAYADGELPLETMTQVEAHLLGCDRCRREVRLQQALADRVATVPAEVVSADLMARVRAVTAQIPTGEVATPARSRHPWMLALGATAAVVLVTLAAWQFVPAVRALTGGSASAPVVLASVPGVVSAVMGDYERSSGRDLPGRARDLETVRAAVAFPVRPLLRDDLRLVGAWTTEIDGELAAVLAYRWHDRLVMQYALSDAALFRSVDIRRALSNGQSIVASRGALSLLGWTESQSASLLVGDVTWNTLRELQPVSR